MSNDVIWAILVVLCFGLGYAFGFENGEAKAINRNAKSEADTKEET